MKYTPTLSKITIYPVKSLDGISLQKAVVTHGGCLLHDREYAITNEEGNYIIGKSNPLVHSLRTEFDLENSIISFRRQNESIVSQFNLTNERSLIEKYLSDYFGEYIKFHQNKTGRFLDIPDLSGVTVISNSSLETVSSWYNNLDVEEARRRFRATLEIANVPAFWEDYLFTADGSRVEFKIGEVTIQGVNPRARCVVPTRHPLTGEVLFGFPKIFAKHRAETLPVWSALESHGHYYHLSVDCYIAPSEIGKSLSVGDELRIG
ncbi:MAG: MOSC N-terminal beta barrel domain-containing protein [Bacteroidota bacterium]|nr:MOSC N-terminal beta barrel domain-containing protein [Bacteroidota bacterium]